VDSLSTLTALRDLNLSYCGHITVGAIRSLAKRLSPSLVRLGIWSRNFANLSEDDNLWSEMLEMLS
jgi:hypothetical protein